MMIRCWYIAALLFAFFLTAEGQSPRPMDRGTAKVKEDVLKVEREWTEAYKSRDKDVLNRVLADDFIFTDDEGRVSDKAQYIEAVVNVIRVESYSLDDLAVRVAGDAAVVTGIWSGKATVAGADASGDFRYTDTLVRRGGRWQVLASQDTRIAAKK